jgi:predicted alpha/beta superfamily hydrolase
MPRLLIGWVTLFAAVTTWGQGRVVFEGKIDSVALTAPRMVRVWVPPSYGQAPDRRFPVLYVHDGQNVFSVVGTNVAFGWGSWELDLTADRLIQAGRLQEIILVSVDCSPNRYEEYRGPARAWTEAELAAMEPRRRPPAPGDDRAYEAYRRFLVNELKPRIDREYRTMPGAAHTGVLGSSLGGLCSLAMAWERPDVFGLAASMSGAFQVEGSHFLAKVLRGYAGSLKPVRIYVDSGVMSMGGGDDGLENSTAVVQELRRIGWKPGVDLLHYVDRMPLTEMELERLKVRRDKWTESATSQHNELYWRVRVARALEFLFPAGSGKEMEAKN